MRNILIFLSVLFLTACSSNGVSTEKNISKSNIDTAIAKTVDYFDSDDFVKESYIELSDRTIVMVIQLQPTATREDGLKYLDNMARMLNMNIASLGGDVDNATKNYLGGLYDIYEINGRAITSAEHTLVNVTKGIENDYLIDFD